MLFDFDSEPNVKIPPKKYESSIDFSQENYDSGNF